MGVEEGRTLTMRWSIELRRSSGDSARVTLVVRMFSDIMVIGGVG